MKYAKPQLRGCSAMAAIQDINNVQKQTSDLEINPEMHPSQPAYQADE
jgi:hypothetical protein